MDANTRLRGTVCETVDKFLSFRECQARIQDKWQCPAEHVSVEWRVTASPPADDAAMLDALAILGFKDPAVGLEPRLPGETTAGILQPCTLEAELEQLIDDDEGQPAHGADGNPVAATSDVDGDDDWLAFI